MPARRCELLDADGAVTARLPRDRRPPSGWDASYRFHQPEPERVLDQAVHRHADPEAAHGWEVTAVHDIPKVRRSASATGAPAARDSSPRRTPSARTGPAAPWAPRAAAAPLEDLGFQADRLVEDLCFHTEESVPGIPDNGQICDPARPSHLTLMGGPHVRSWRVSACASQCPARASGPASAHRSTNRPAVACARVVLVRPDRYVYGHAADPAGPHALWERPGRTWVCPDDRQSALQPALTPCGGPAPAPPSAAVLRARRRPVRRAPPGRRRSPRRGPRRGGLARRSPRRTDPARSRRG